MHHCVFKRLGCKKTLNFYLESITFSETEYGENQNYARKISASCSYWPCKSGPLYDAEIYQAGNV